ncbi:MAG TPA: questin oxidase family protein, partial [Actinophytocola sp.]|nr:questin oxidase family protein [Actinophytocola sp.]
MDQLLTEAYERLHRHGPEFGGDEEGNHGLTNHGPMAAEVMVRRGLDIDLHRWLDGYVPRLTELPAPGDRIAESSWPDALGDGRRIADWTEFFARRLAEQPWREVLVTWWPRLLPGIVAGSTHGVIRVGHAVRALTAGEQGPAVVTELGHGLAFWAARARVLPGFTVPAGDRSPAQALRAVPRLADQSGLIAHRVGRLAELPGWPAALAALRAPAAPADVPTLLDDLVETATLHYRTHGHGSPVLLVHTATAPNAVRHTLPVLPESMWVASLA